MEAITQRLAKAFTIGAQAVSKPPMIYKVIKP